MLTGTDTRFELAQGGVSGAGHELFHFSTAAALLVLTLASPASAQSTVRTFDLERVTPTPASEHSLLLESGDALRAGAVRVALATQYEHDPLVLREAGVRMGAVVGSRLSQTATLAWAASDWVQLGLVVPVVLFQRGDDLTDEGVARLTPTALGSPFFSARFTALRQASGSPLDLGFSVGVAAPLGSNTAYTVDPGAGLRVGGKVGAGRTLVPWLRVGAELGLELRSTQTLSEYTTTVRDQVGSLWSVGAVASTVGPGLRFEVDARATMPLTQTAAGLEVLGGVRYPFAKGFELSALGGFGAGQLPGTAAYRVMAGLSWTFEPAPKALPSGEQVSRLALPAERSEAQEDADQDGVPDEADECVDVPGPAALHGCPAAEGDGGPVELATEDHVFDTRVHFAVDSAVVSPELAEALREVARVFATRSPFDELLVVGHTDSTGPRAWNQALSVRRAQAVRQALIGFGVDPLRLYVEGVGPTRPTASNADGTGRALNRRAELVTQRRQPWSSR